MLPVRADEEGEHEKGRSDRERGRGSQLNGSSLIHKLEVKSVIGDNFENENGERPWKYSG